MQVVELDEPAIGLRGWIVLDSVRLGPAFGGIRRLPYADAAAALDDARRLAGAMTLKCALAGLDAGGGKTAIIDHSGLDRAAAYAAVGRAVEDLGGEYVCGPDVGTGDAELAHVRRETNWVNPEGNDANAATARGVLAGIRGVLAHLGIPSPADATFVVQGLGGVGATVARQLVAAGARVLGCDVNPAAARGVPGVEVIDPGRALAEPCDVLVPCALGGILTIDGAGALAARAVCGSANNQLAHADAAQALTRAGVLWVPDFLASAGAVIEGVVTIGTGAGPQRERARAEAGRLIDGIEATTRRVLDAAGPDGATTLDAATALARARVASAPAPV